MPWLVSTIACALSWSLVSPPAVAMTCSPIDPARVAAEAEIAFVGTVISVAPSDYSPSGLCWTATHGPECGGKIVTLDVTRGLKGAAPGRIRVLAEDGCNCLGGYFKGGLEYLVVARTNPTPFPADVLVRNSCWGTGPAQPESARTIINRLSTAPR